MEKNKKEIPLNPNCQLHPAKPVERHIVLAENEEFIYNCIKTANVFDDISVENIQKWYKLGYNAAGRIFDLLKERGEIYNYMNTGVYRMLLIPSILSIQESIELKDKISDRINMFADQLHKHCGRDPILHSCPICDRPKHPEIKFNRPLDTMVPFDTYVNKPLSEHKPEPKVVYTPVAPMEDEDGHWYIIPLGLKESFILDRQNLDMIDSGEFGEKYDVYRTGGDLNLVQLYVKSEI